MPIPYAVSPKIKKNPNSDLNRENCFRQEFEKMIMVTKFPKVWFLENQNRGFSTSRSREKHFVLKVYNDRAINSLQNETSSNFLRSYLQKL
jgi:hypothetical protein